MPDVTFLRARGFGVHCEGSLFRVGNRLVDADELIASVGGLLPASLELNFTSELLVAESSKAKLTILCPAAFCACR